MKKMSLSNIKTLTRTEMKKIMAGSGNACNAWCTVATDCDKTCPTCEENSNWGNKKMCVA